MIYSTLKLIAFNTNFAEKFVLKIIKGIAIESRVSMGESLSVFGYPLSSHKDVVSGILLQNHFVIAERPIQLNSI